MPDFLKPFIKKLFRLFFSEQSFEAYSKERLLLPGCSDENLLVQYQKGNLAKIEKPLSFYYDELWVGLEKRVKQKKPFVYIRASDGEANFLLGKFVGNVGRRHYTADDKIPAASIDLFRDGLLSCDSRHVEMYRNTRRDFKKIFGQNIFSPIPFECLYAIISSRKIFNSPWRIGIIGADNKIEIIKELFKHQQYQDYIGRSAFDGYIGVPEKGTSNQPLELAQSIIKRLDPSIDIYLVGIGIAKLAVLPELKKSSRSVFFDAGAGVSALAGLVSAHRQYFADWINFRLKDFNYSAVDIMDANLQSSTNSKWL
jgi:hypothetical protein